MDCQLVTLNTVEFVVWMSVPWVNFRVCSEPVKLETPKNNFWEVYFFSEEEVHMTKHKT
jgi:hypothetical protein